jgi:hypothetical protein
MDWSVRETVSEALAEAAPSVAVIVVAPLLRAAATPLEVIVATVALLEVHVTVLVEGCTLPSL